MDFRFTYGFHKTKILSNFTKANENLNRHRWRRVRCVGDIVNPDACIGPCGPNCWEDLQILWIWCLSSVPFCLTKSCFDSFMLIAPNC